MEKPTIVWFRQDLRLRDNPALWHAAREKTPVVPLYIYDTKNPGEWEIGRAQKIWLFYSLESLKKDLKKMGLDLILRKGDPERIIDELKKELGSEKLYFNTCYEPFALKRDAKFKNAQQFQGSLLISPDTIKTNQNDFYKVFTPFYNSFMKIYEHENPLGLPKLIPYKKKIASDDLEDFELIPKKSWVGKIRDAWEFGEKAAHKRLGVFKKEAVRHYEKYRDIPSIDGTSKLSPYLHMGEISPRQIWDALHDIKGSEPYLRQLVWREFCYAILYHVKKFPDTSYNENFRNFPWSKKSESLKQWQKGQTGIPIIDAGMRQLWQTGWMHNRVRMITASLLTKNLKHHWIEGARWYWDTLVDADLANNSFGWQWVAGCGFDAAPYHRIFNPIIQGEKFDKDGAFVKKWVPELKNLSKKWIHKPWEAPIKELEKAKIVLGNDYPEPICDLKQTRKEALDRYERIK